MSRRFDNFQARLEGRGKTAGGSDDVSDEPTPNNPVEPEADSTDAKETSDMSTETPLTEREDYKAGHAAGTKAASDRMTTVFAHENARGREAAAARLLGTAMTADEITQELAHQPKTDPAAALTEEEQREAAEEGGRKEMKAAIDETENSNIDASGGGKKDASADSASVWDKAYAKVFPHKGN